MDAVIFAPGTATIVPMGMFAGLLYIVTPDWAVAMDGMSKCVVGRLLLALAPMVAVAPNTNTARNLLVSISTTKNAGLMRARPCVGQ